MKVALIQAPFWGIKSPPLGLACLSAYIKNRGYQVYKRDLNIEAYSVLKNQGLENLWQLNQPMWGDYKQVLAFYEEHKELFTSYVNDILIADPEVIGFSILWSTEIMSRLLATEIKKINPKKIIIFGGPQCTVGYFSERIIALPQIDFVVCGEGEATLYELLEALKNNQSIKGIESLYSKHEKFCGTRPLIKNINSLPFPDFDDYKFDLYLQPVMLATNTSRGCPNRCIYCDEKIFWNIFRSYPGERIFEEIRYQAEKYNIDRFEFTDSLVNGNIKSLEKFCDLVIENNLKISWMSQAAVRKEMTRELLQKIKDSGCFHLCFGMEHFSQELLQKMGKVLCKNVDFDRLIRNCFEVQLPTGLNWMFGFPGETDEDFQADLDFFTRNVSYMEYISVNNSQGFCGFTPNCYAYEHPDDIDIILGPDACTWKSKDNKNTYVTRLLKYQKFCDHLDTLKIKYSFPKFKNENELIGNYYFNCEKDYNLALEYYKKELLQNENSEHSKEYSIKCSDLLKGESI